MFLCEVLCCIPLIIHSLSMLNSFCALLSDSVAWMTHIRLPAGNSPAMTIVGRGQIDPQQLLFIHCTPQKPECPAALLVALFDLVNIACSPATLHMFISHASVQYPKTEAYKLLETLLPKQSRDCCYLDSFQAGYVIMVLSVGLE